MKPDPATALTFDVGGHDAFLSTRDRGRKVLHDLEERISSGTNRLVIDFTNVEAMTLSFADEFLGKYYSMLATRDDGPATVFVAGLNEDTRAMQTTDSNASSQRGPFSAGAESPSVAARNSPTAPPRCGWRKSR